MLHPLFISDPYDTYLTCVTWQNEHEQLTTAQASKQCRTIHFNTDIRSEFYNRHLEFIYLISCVFAEAGGFNMYD